MEWWLWAEFNNQSYIFCICFGVNLVWVTWWTIIYLIWIDDLWEVDFFSFGCCLLHEIIASLFTRRKRNTAVVIDARIICINSIVITITTQIVRIVLSSSIQRECWGVVVIWIYRKGKRCFLSRILILIWGLLENILLILLMGIRRRFFFLLITIVGSRMEILHHFFELCFIEFGV